MRWHSYAVLAGLALAVLAACAPVGVQRLQQDQIQTDIDTSRTLRGDSLSPASTMPHRLPGAM